MKVANFLFWSVTPVDIADPTPSPNPSPNPSPSPTQNPDEIFGPGGLCDIEGQYLPTEKGDVMLCGVSGAKLRWALTSDPLPINGIYPGMKCDSLGLALIGGNGKNLECSQLKDKQVWIIKK